MKNKLISILVGLFTALISACASQNPSPIKPVSYVNLNQFIGDWCVIAYLDKDYTSTIIARNARDYVWIMAGMPFIDGILLSYFRSLSFAAYR